ncbi:hypothetical protein [uncultured Methanobrevibacter sp.]|uniref:hypothetical protein n=1 Tax=uncultured Methanobrevibacter sp. TaxID=253161 RepID=UPI0025F459D6|nr:hypothetical protein [uncultured Methanobrevibacter sp.]
MKYYNADVSYEIGDNVYCILTTHSNPNIIIPIKAKITDVQWDAVNPLYKIRVTKFFENLQYLEENFINSGYRTSFESAKIKRPVMSTVVYKTVEEFTAIINKDNEFVVDGTLCVRTQEQLSELFETIEFYIISTYLRDLKSHVTRSFLDGPFKMTKLDFNNKFKECMESKFTEYKTNINKYLQSLDNK